MRSSATGRRGLIIGSTAHAVQDGLGAAIYVLLPVLAQAFGLSYAQVGLAKGLKSLTQGLLELCSGFISERIGETRVLVSGLLLSGSGFLLLVLAPGATFILLCLLIIGAGTAFHHAPSCSLISNCVPGDRRRSALGLYNAAGDVGKLAFTACFSLAVAIGLAWQTTAAWFGLAAVASAAGIAFAGSMIAPPHHATNDIRETPGEAIRKQRWGILDRKGFSSLLAIVFFDNMAQAGILVFIPFLMISKGMPVYIATFAAVIVLAGGVFGKAGCGYLAERMGVKPAFGVIQILTAVGIGCVIVAPEWLAFALLFPLGIVAQGSTSVTYGIVNDLVDPNRTASGYALMYGATSIAAASGPFLFGFAADRIGIEMAMATMAILALLATTPTVYLPSHGVEPQGST